MRLNRKSLILIALAAIGSVALLAAAPTRTPHPRNQRLRGEAAPAAPEER